VRAKSWSVGSWLDGVSEVLAGLCKCFSRYFFIFILISATSRDSQRKNPVMRLITDGVLQGVCNVAEEATVFLPNMERNTFTSPSQDFDSVPWNSESCSSLYASYQLAARIRMPELVPLLLHASSTNSSILDPSHSNSNPGSISTGNSPSRSSSGTVIHNTHNLHGSSEPGFASWDRYQQTAGEREYKQRNARKQIQTHAPGLLGAAQNTIQCFRDGQWFAGVWNAGTLAWSCALLASTGGYCTVIVQAPPDLDGLPGVSISIGGIL
jgi:hypothetical protein